MYVLCLTIKHSVHMLYYYFSPIELVVFVNSKETQHS